jgi:hypothetical protein
MEQKLTGMDRMHRMKDRKVNLGFEISNFKSEILNPVHPVHPC